MDRATTYKVRIYKTEVYKGSRVTTYYVRWRVDDKQLKEAFRTVALADSFRSELMTATRAGEAFSVQTSRPVSWSRAEPGTASLSWYAFTLGYVAAKWPYVSPNHRRGIAEALTDAAEVMLTSSDAPHTRDEIRRALLRWAYSDRIRGTKEPPDDMVSVIRWLKDSTIPVADLAEPGTGPARARAILDRISKNKDGTAAAANTANRKRMVLNNAFQYAVETNALHVNPLHAVKWTRPRTLKTVDPRAVVNSDHARRFLVAVAGTGPRGERMVAFYGCMYYAALRPEEAVDLRRDNLVDLPDDGWGEMLLTHSEPRSGTSWTDNGQARQRREASRPRKSPTGPGTASTSCCASTPSASPASKTKPSDASPKQPSQATPAARPLRVQPPPSPAHMTCPKMPAAPARRHDDLRHVLGTASRMRPLRATCSRLSQDQPRRRARRSRDISRGGGRCWVRTNVG